MADKLTDRDLCIALSNLFLDTEIDYSAVAKKLNQFELPYIENALLDMVAPVLHWAFYSVATEWAGYDEDWLWSQIQKVSDKNKNAGFISGKLLKIRHFYMSKLLNETWQKFTSEFKKQRQ